MNGRTERLTHLFATVGTECAAAGVLEEAFDALEVAVASSSDVVRYDTGEGDVIRAACEAADRRVNGTPRPSPVRPVQPQRGTDPPPTEPPPPPPDDVQDRLDRHEDGLADLRGKVDDLAKIYEIFERAVEGKSRPREQRPRLAIVPTEGGT